jgi:cell division protein FtsB
MTAKGDFMPSVLTGTGILEIIKMRKAGRPASCTEDTAMAENRSSRRSRQNRLSMILAVLVVAILFVAVYINGSSMRRELEENQEKITRLKQEIEEEELRSRSIEEYRAYTETDQFIEQVAREKLGLLYEGETIFRESD